MPSDTTLATESAYDVSAGVGTPVPAIAAEWLEASAGVKARRGFGRTLSYGADPALAVDIFEAEGRSRGLVLFLHGGFWLQGSKDLAAFPADLLAPEGIAYASATYGLAPRYTLGELIEHARSAYEALIAEREGVDAHRIVVAGHSAGAFLAAWLARAGSVTVPPAGLMLISGIYDLAPLVGIRRLAPLGLDERQCQQLSIRGGDLPPDLPVEIVVGECEPVGFRDQALTFSRQARDAGAAPGVTVVAAADHFSITRSLGTRNSPAGRMLCDLVLGRTIG